MGEQMALLPMPTKGEYVLLGRLDEARREIAIARSLLAAAWEREKLQDATIRELRRELLEAHDVVGRAEGTCEVEAQELIQRHWTCAPDTDRRMMGR